MNQGLSKAEFLVISVAFLTKNIFHRYIKLESLLSLSYSSTDNWASVLESDALLKSDIPLYEGDTIHQPPLLIYMWSSVINLPVIGQFFLFGAIDAASIWLALKLTNEIVSFYTERRITGINQKSNTIANLSDLKVVRLYVCLWYAFNPFLAVSTLSQCITSIHNAVLLILFYQIVRGNYKCGSLLCAWLTYTSLYPVVLLLALYSSIKWDTKKCVHIALIFLLGLGSLLGVSYYLVGSNFIQNVYLHHFYFNDSTPQMNLYWYMMVTLFDHFRLFFKCTFQFVIFALCGGLAIKYSDDQAFLAYMLMWTTTVLKPYPSIGELGQLLALMPIYKHLFPYLRGGLVTIVMFLCVLCLGPLMQYLWMSSGTANANFYFAITLVHCAAQSHLASSILSAYAKYNFHAKFGKTIKNVDGSDGELRAK